MQRDLVPFVLFAATLHACSVARADADAAGADTARAEAAPARAEIARAPGVVVRPTLAGGFVYALIGYEGYAFGADVRAGVDLEIEGERSHLLAIDVGWTGLAITGARLDLLPISIGWRWVPAPEIGFYTLVAVGAGLALDGIDAQLGARSISSTTARPLTQVAAGIGITIVEHLDVEVFYRQAVLGGEATDALGTVGARVGGRL